MEGPFEYKAPGFISVFCLLEDARDRYASPAQFNLPLFGD